MKSLILAFFFALIALVAATPQFYRERPSYEVGFDRNGRVRVYQEQPSIEYYGGNFAAVSNYRPQVISRPSYRQNRRF